MEENRLNGRFSCFADWDDQVDAVVLPIQESPDRFILTQNDGFHQQAFYACSPHILLLTNNQANCLICSRSFRINCQAFQY